MYTMMALRIKPLLYLTALLGFGATLVEARSSRAQFKEFFSTFNSWYEETMKEPCSGDYQTYLTKDNPPGQHQHAWGLANCILTRSTDVMKAEMGLSAALLTLLPVGLAQIRPSLTETGLLAMRRPFLALLLEFGTPSPNPITNTIGGENVRNMVSRPLPRQLELLRPYRYLLSALEYILAIGSTANCIYQIYRLTYNAVALAPIAVYLAGLSETAVMFGWVILILPIHYWGVITFAYTYPVSGKRTLGQFLEDEITPCCYSTRKIRFKKEVPEKRPMQAFLEFFANLVSCLHIMVGTVLLGSILFITLGDVLPVIESFVGAALVTRLVTTMELEGMKMANYPDPKKPEEAEATTEGDRLIDKC